MPTDDQKIAFSRRLQLAMRRSTEPIKGATELSLRFNLRYQGNPVSPQTAHKWLSGRSIPSADKLAVLASWLDVSEHWLQFGPPPKASTAAKKTEQHRASDDAQVLATRILALPPHQRYLIEELVNQLQETGEP